MISFKEKYFVLKEIYSKPKNILIILVTTLAIYLLNAVIVQWSNLKLAGTISLTSLLTEGVYYSVTKTTFYSSIIIALLTGMLISLLAHKSKENLSKKGKIKGFLPSIAVFLGLLAPGCASCGIGLAAVLGLGGAIFSLPFKGLEISFLAIALLLYSVNRTLSSFIVCETPLVQKKRKR